MSDSHDFRWDTHHRDKATNRAPHQSRAAAVLVRVAWVPVLQHCAVALLPKKDVRHALTALVCPRPLQLNNAVANCLSRMLRRMLLNANTSLIYAQYLDAG